MTSLRVLRPGPLTTVQDRGRRGWGHLGIPLAGAVDRAALDAVNAALGNPPDSAALEIVLGGVELVAESDAVLAISGADVPVSIDGRPCQSGRLLALAVGERLRIGSARTGVYAYLGMLGGVAADGLLGSRSRDTLSDLGPRPLHAGDVLVASDREAKHPAESTSVLQPPIDEEAPLRLLPGPHLGLMPEGVVTTLTGQPWRVLPASNRIAVRLTGQAIVHQVAGVSSEPLVPGAVQLPPDGQPIAFLSNHPVTGGYPVVGVVQDTDVRQLAQRRPGRPVHFTATW